MKLKVAGKSHIGMKRKINEDSLLISSDLGLYIIADGMGGHRAGEVASRMVVETMRDYWQKFFAGEVPSFLNPIEKDISDKAKHLVNSISLANIVVHEAQKKPQYHRMGSTVSVLIIENDHVWMANVGDSPVYIYEKGELRLVSEEHSIEAEQKSMGFYDSLSSTNPLMKNMLTRVLGPEEKVEVYISRLNLEPGDLILMCSDGLTNYLSEGPIRVILDDYSMTLERKVDILIDEANKGGGGDNISVILLEMFEDGKWNKLIKRFKSKE
jgi:protein phosphatase